jgi:hypothetical protein
VILLETKIAKPLVTSYNVFPNPSLVPKLKVPTHMKKKRKQ